MREILKQPIVWIMIIVTLLGGAALAGTTGRPSDEVTLDSPEMSTSAAVDGVDSGTGDGLSSAASGTVRDVQDEAGQTPPQTERFDAILVADPADRCLWLVNITDQNPANLFLVAWPPNAVVSWDPLVVSANASEFGDGSMLSGSGLIYLDVAAAPIDADDHRLAGTGSCEANGLVDLDAVVALQ